MSKKKRNECLELSYHRVISCEHLVDYPDYITKTCYNKQYRDFV